MRIYEISQSYHVDLAKIVAIRQHFESVKKQGRNGKFERAGKFDYEAWIEITLESGRHIEVDCSNLNNMCETYNMILQAWRCYVGDYGEQPMLYETVDTTNHS